VLWNVTQSPGSLVIPKFWLKLSHVLQGDTWAVDYRRQLFLGNLKGGKKTDGRMRAIRSPRTSGPSKQTGQLLDYFRPEVTVPTARIVYVCSKEFRSQDTDWLQHVNVYHVLPPFVWSCTLAGVNNPSSFVVFGENVRKHKL
jgi:hypothetical protein